MGFLRRHTLPVVCLAAAAVIGIAAVIDHRYKSRRIGRAEVSEWYCVHEGVRCGGPSPYWMERHWNERQVAYEVAVAVLGGLAVVSFAVRTVRR